MGSARALYTCNLPLRIFFLGWDFYHYDMEREGYAHKAHLINHIAKQLGNIQ